MRRNTAEWKEERIELPQSPPKTTFSEREHQESKATEKNLLKTNKCQEFVWFLDFFPGLTPIKFDLNSDQKEKMTSTVKNIVGGVLAVAAILGVAALFVNVTRSRGSKDGEVEEEGRKIFGRSLEERDASQKENDGDDVEILMKNGEKTDEDAKMSPNEVHGHKRKLWVLHPSEAPDEQPVPQS